MDFTYPRETERFRAEVRSWLADHLVGDYDRLGTGTELHEHDWPMRVAWERAMGQAGWIGLSWPKSFGGRAATPIEELVFAEEYARANGPTRAGTFGEGMLGPTLIHFGTTAQKQRFLPRILRGEEIWCQGFSEPGAGSDLASLSTSARLDGNEWVIDGQKVWTSQAHLSDWIFVLARTNADVPKHKGMSFLMVSLDQPGIEVRPIVDIAGGRHFCEVFFDGARTAADLIVGAPGDGWKLAMSTLGFERGTAFIGQLRRYGAEFDRLVSTTRERGMLGDRVVRQRVADLYIGLELMRFGLFRTVTALVNGAQPGPEASIGKLVWSQWHQDLGVLAMDVLGPDGMTVNDAGDRHDMQHGFLFARAHSIYAGASQIQRNIIGERILGLPKEPAG